MKQDSGKSKRRGGRGGRTTTAKTKVAHPPLPSIREQSIAPPDARSEPEPNRQAPRAPAALYCEIDGLPMNVDLNAIADDGFFVLTPVPAEMDAELDVFLRLGDTQCNAAARVVRSVSCEQAAKLGTRPGFELRFGAGMSGRASWLALLRTLRKTVAKVPPARAATQPVLIVKADKAPPAPARPALPIRSHSAEELALVYKLQSERAALAKKTPWEVLGVSQSASAEQAKAAFFLASKRYHPHLYNQYQSPELSALATELFIAHKHAYDTFNRSARPKRGR